MAAAEPLSAQRNRLSCLVASNNNFKKWRQQCGLLVWILCGLVSYGSVWMILLADDRQSYTRVASLHQSNTIQAQQVLEQQRELEQHRTEWEQTRREQKQTNISGKPGAGGDGNSSSSSSSKDFFDWSFWGLCVCFSLMSYVRIRLEPSRRRQRRRRRDAAAAGMTSISNNYSSEESREAVLHTLRRINRDRASRGETTPITLDAYQALRMALLQDRTLLRGLAGHRVPPPNRGATPEQLETLCQQLTVAEEDDYEGDCCICLASFQINDQVRILPCSHSYHRDCIDHWFQQSILCPICKHSLDAELQV
jgi:hypothetical protein